jgi:Tfp pilus assembly protein PilO
MKAANNSSTPTIVAILVIVGLAIAFWALLLSPKRSEADKLGKEADQLTTSVTEARSALLAGERARRQFPKNYQQLVVLGKAVPVSDETASLLVQLNKVAKHSHVRFEGLQVGAADGTGEAAESTEETAPPPEEGGEEAESGVTPAAATEAAASLQPLGAQVGPAGLSVLPYDLTFSGQFFDVADFIHGLDKLITTKDGKVGVDGRLVTIDGFSLAPGPDPASGKLAAEFSVTTYLIPPGEGLTAGASPAEPAPVTGESSTTATDLR